MKKGILIASAAAAAFLLAGCFHTASTEPATTDSGDSEAPAAVSEPAPAPPAPTAAPAPEKKAEEKKEEKKVEAKPQVFSFESANFSFKPSAITVKANEPVTFNFANTGFHTFTIDELGVDVDLRSKPSGAVTFTPTKKGTFSFYCAIPGHKASGMSGTITVE